MRHWGFDLWPYENGFWVACKGSVDWDDDGNCPFRITEDRDEITCTACLDSYDETEREMKEYEASK